MQNTTQHFGQLGVCYYPEQWSPEQWHSDAQLMVQMGITHVRIAEFSWVKIEPALGFFDWQWLDDAVATLAAEGLKLILCTPTATPPRWLVAQEPGILALDAQLQPKRFGSRRHYCFSSPIFREHSRRITHAITGRYGRHPSVVGWQTDNEYGCHFTVQSHSVAAQLAFQHWLQNKYTHIETLNFAWGTVFWGQTYDSFSQITSPHQTVTESNPALSFDWRLFSSDAVVDFNREQVAIIREQSPQSWITHNFMGFFTQFDHHKVSQDLDVVGYDNYPIGFTQDFFLTEPEKKMWFDTGHPDIASFHYDLYRGMKPNRRWAVLEQQPGPVNWATWNPIPKDGMVRLWTWQALAHGAELVSYFRWRQNPQAQEQMHAGLLMPNSEEAQGAKEVRQVHRELMQLSLLDQLTGVTKHGENNHGNSNQNNNLPSIALVFDYATQWMAEITPHGKDYNALELVFRIYSTLRELGLDVDIVSPAANLTAYRLVILASNWHIDANFQYKLQSLPTSTHLLVLPRTCSKTKNMGIADANVTPSTSSTLQQLAGVKVRRVGSLPPSVTFSILDVKTQMPPSSGTQGTQWFEEIDTENMQAQAVWVNQKNQPVVTISNNQKTTFVATVLNAEGWRCLLSKVCQKIDLLPIMHQGLPFGLRISRHKQWILAVNFSNSVVSWHPQQNHKCVLGETDIKAQGVAIWTSDVSTD